ncbi:MAG: hypothetical protein QXT25_02305 [Candidatus Anstonellaceae archaeon]
MKMPAAVLIVASLLVAGCLTDAESKYDEIKKGYESQIMALNEKLAQQESKIFSLEARIAECAAAKEGMQTKLNALDAELGKARKEGEILEATKSKVNEMELLNELEIYYNQTYGPKGVPNTYRLKKIEELVSSISFEKISQAWAVLKSCSNMIECERARLAFADAISQRQCAIGQEIVEMLKNVSSQ